MPKLAISDEDIMNCFEVMSELRPHLQREDFLSTIREMEQGGFKLLYLKEGGAVVAVAGYRVARNLYMGKHLYVDDLVTALAHRSKGYGETLISWLRKAALSEGCQFLHLDSGTQRARAHKFYFEQGFTIASYHFSEGLVEG